MRTTPDTEESIRCTVSGCTCVCFKPGSVQLRSCDRCGHGWVPHAMEKLHLQAQQPSSCGPVEVALPGPVFDLSSLVLYGAQAVPVRLKILLDRLYSILTPEQVGHILHTLGWSLGDYVRGYMLQFPNGKVLDRWLMVTPDEELLILKQFLRFGETRPIVELMALQCMAAVSHLPNPELNSAPKSCQSNINTFIKQNGGTPGVLRKTRGVAGVCCFKKSGLSLNDNTVHHFENLPGGQSLIPSFHFPSSTFHCLAPPTKELVPPSKLPQFLRKPSGTELAERHVHEGGRRAQENEVILEQAKGELPIKIKADPENPTGSIWHQNPRTNEDWERDLHKTKQEHTSSLIHTSSSFPSSITSFSSPPISQRLQDSSYSCNPLPSFSSSFLCPPPTSSFSSSLHPLPYSSSSLRPLPSSLCSLPSLSPAGGRKGRVCCGVCGKSFYDKGTLKIHYNAVHLKIKHRCTVAGCTMVFSSLRSRNRHSANPNPRLHTGASRDTHPHRNTHTSIHSETQTHKDKSAHKSIHNTHTHVGGEEEISSTLWHQEDDAHTLRHLHTLKNGHSHSQDGHQDNTPPQADSPPSSPLQTWSKDTIHGVSLGDSTYRSHLHTQAPPPPPLPSACGASPLGSPPSLIPLEKTERCQILLSLHTKHTAHDPPSGSTYSTTASRSSRPASRDDEITEGQRREACTSPLTSQQRLWESSDPVPKKKSRKSSMPVKIEREKVALRRTEEEEG